MSVRRDRSHVPGLVAVLDVGTSKVCCVVAAPDANGVLNLLGLGYQRSRGLKSGMVVDPDEAERVVRSAVAQAERMAGFDVRRAAVALNCGRFKIASFTARAEVRDRVVTDADMTRLLSGADAFVERGGRTLVQMSRSDWMLDGVAGAPDPRGMAARELSLAINAATADEAPLRNVLNLIERSHLETERLVLAPFASGLATTTAEERTLGVLVVEMGAGVTSLAGFQDGRLQLADMIAVGGNHVTYDISRALATPVVEAERIKTLYGTLVKAASDHSESISFPSGNVEDGEQAQLFHISKAQLRAIIEPRIAGLFDLISERLAGGPFADPARCNVVLTGGASQLLGVDQAWCERFGGRVRIGRPQPLGRMPSSTCGPAFSTLVGLTMAGQTSERFGAGSVAFQGPGSGGYLARMQQWVRESF